MSVGCIVDVAAVGRQSVSKGISDERVLSSNNAKNKLENLQMT